MFAGAGSTQRDFGQTFGGARRHIGTALQHSFNRIVNLMLLPVSLEMPKLLPKGFPTR